MTVISLDDKYFTDVVVRVNSYIISSGDIEKPDNNVKIKCDLWFADGKGWKSALKVNRIQGCIVDLDNKIICDSKGNVLRISNLKQVFDRIISEIA